LFILVLNDVVLRTSMQTSSVVMQYKNQIVNFVTTVELIGD